MCTSPPVDDGGGGQDYLYFVWVAASPFSANLHMLPCQFHGLGIQPNLEQHAVSHFPGGFYGPGTGGGYIEWGYFPSAMAHPALGAFEVHFIASEKAFHGQDRVSHLLDGGRLDADGL